MADNKEALQNITARLDMIYGKLTVIEGLIRDKATDKEGTHPLGPNAKKHNNSFLLEAGIEEEETMLSEQQKAEETATAFITAIMEALKSGKYYLKEKCKNAEKEESRVFLGYYDDNTITLISSLAFKIYADYMGIKNNALSISGQIRPALLYSSLAFKRKERSDKLRFKGKYYCTIRISLSRAEELYSKTKALISANNKGQADIRAHIKPTE